MTANSDVLCWVNGRPVTVQQTEGGTYILESDTHREELSELEWRALVQSMVERAEIEEAIQGVLQKVLQLGVKAPPDLVERLRKTVHKQAREQGLCKTGGLPPKLSKWLGLSEDGDAA
jgi:hypothetical protein